MFKALFFLILQLHLNPIRHDVFQCEAYRVINNTTYPLYYNTDINKL